ncbi:MAG: hypothetical protein ACREPD_14430 [Stenotrophomonas sp.]|uniref:hypothetical protein n=1 Tax=Stenotrophomonas sp. TaxID=69392 RepID=UPI003D6D9B06
MDRLAAAGREEHCDHTAWAEISVEGAQGCEAHALLKANDFAHGAHLVATPPHNETMKLAAFRGES